MRTPSWSSTTSGWTRRSSGEADRHRHHPPTGRGAGRKAARLVGRRPGARVRLRTAPAPARGSPQSARAVPAGARHGPRIEEGRQPAVVAPAARAGVPIIDRIGARARPAVRCRPLELDCAGRAGGRRRPRRRGPPSRRSSSTPRPWCSRRPARSGRRTSRESPARRTAGRRRRGWLLSRASVFSPPPRIECAAVARTWLQLRVELLGALGEGPTPAPGRIFIVGTAHSFAALADAINAAFARWDLVASSRVRVGRRAADRIRRCLRRHRGRGSGCGEGGRRSRSR